MGNCGIRCLLNRGFGGASSPILEQTIVDLLWGNTVSEMNLNNNQGLSPSIGVTLDVINDERKEPELMTQYGSLDINLSSSGEIPSIVSSSNVPDFQFHLLFLKKIRQEYSNLLATLINLQKNGSDLKVNLRNCEYLMDQLIVNYTGFMSNVFNFELCSRTRAFLNALIVGELYFIKQFSEEELLCNHGNVLKVAYHRFYLLTVFQGQEK